MTIGIALLGAGIFATEQHLPAILSAPSLSLKALYSRSQSSVAKLASALSSPVPLYYDSPSSDNTLDALLARDDITAVIVVLPILAQPAIIKKALLAGKHVLSEKPVAANLSDAKDLIAWYAALGDAKPLWAVAENFRYIPSLEYAAAQLAEAGGRVTTFRLARNGLVKAEDKYFNTEWRKTPGYQGGFLLDGGVHFVAALRMLLGAVGERVKQVVGFSGLLEERLLPVDTVSAVALTEGGRSGTVHMSFGTEFKSGLEVEVVTDKGAVTWSPTGVTVVKKVGGERVEEKKEFEYSSGVAREVVGFAEALKRGQLEERQTPAEALRDLEVLQKLLESGEEKAVLKSLAL
ncbi:hypothetical protein OQA88_2596 [Cercophora sp. LCS_1]